MARGVKLVSVLNEENTDGEGSPELDIANLRWTTLAAIPFKH